MSTWVRHTASQRSVERPMVVASVWKRGELLARSTLSSGEDPDKALEQALAVPDATLVYETDVAEAPLTSFSDTVLALSFVSGHDGVAATLGAQTAYVTVDDLLLANAYDHGVTVSALTLTTGTNAAVVWALLAQRLHASVPELRAHASLRRVRFERSTPRNPASPWAVATGETVTHEEVEGALLDAARYLARGIHDDGRFRYMVDALTGRSLPGYDWPRHAGATYFLAQAAARSHEAEIAMACLRAASLIRDSALVSCGGARCVGDGDRADVGSSALALIAFVEIARTGLDPSYAALVGKLATFLRSQQRQDGEFMHEYDRASGHPVDVQYLYYSGEATLALSRAHLVTHDPADLEAATKGLAHLVGPAWSFFGDRYYFGEEHWTCQAMADLWDRAPDPKALDFCVRWQRYGRRMQYGAGETPYDADGAIGVSTLITPRLTPVASRCEAGVATLGVLERTGAEEEAAALDRQLRRSLALLVRRQLRPGTAHLFRDPALVYGAMPGSEVDQELRIDYAQHGGSAMSRWLDLRLRPSPAGRSSAPL